MIRGGTLDVMIVIQTATTVQSPSGEETETWTDLPARPARLQPLQGAERWTGAQMIARAQFAFTIRLSNAVLDVGPNDRIVCPASAADGSPPGKKVYDIFAVEPVGRNEGLRLLAAVRQDLLT